MIWNLPNSVLAILVIGILVAVCSWLASFLTRWLAARLQAVDEPKGGRKIHVKTTPLLGGWGIGFSLILFIVLGTWFGWFGVRDIRSTQLVGFVIGLFILMIGGFLDDRFDLSPRLQILFPILAALSIVVSGTTIVQITSLSGGAISLLSRHWHLSLGAAEFTISFPSDFLTLIWLLAVTYATKFFDGLDGLVSGQMVIGAGLIAALALTHTYFQPSVALLAVIVGAAFFGFLPANLHPAKQFLGESGSTIAGFSLGFLSIVAGTKVATAFMALGLPLCDASLVAFGRLVRGVSPFRGDDTHLHFKLLKTGLSQKKVVLIFWIVALLFGSIALGLQTRGKILLIVALIGLTVLLSFFAGLMIRSRKV
ncbi:MAG TPA: MraY family glycosyltransferase [Patescibacteria group bacterium]|nr:MraY family glycosyltransferase [Patescibacteria group bacterium]